MFDDLTLWIILKINIFRVFSKDLFMKKPTECFLCHIGMRQNVSEKFNELHGEIQIYCYITQMTKTKHMM